MLILGSTMKDHKTLAESEAIYLDTSVFPKLDIEHEKKANATRVLVFFTSIPIFFSWVSLVEYLGVLRRKENDKEIGTDVYLECVRRLLGEIERRKFQLVHPPMDRWEFHRDAGPLIRKYSRLGGGDIWHLLATVQLVTKHPRATLLSFDRDLIKAAKEEGIRAVYGKRVNHKLLIEELRTRDRLRGM